MKRQMLFCLLPVMSIVCLYGQQGEVLYNSGNTSVGIIKMGKPGNNGINFLFRSENSDRWEELNPGEIARIIMGDENEIRYLPVSDPASPEKVKVFCRAEVEGYLDLLVLSLRGGRERYFVRDNKAVTRELIGYNGDFPSNDIPASKQYAYIGVLKRYLSICSEQHNLIDNTKFTPAGLKNAVLVINNCFGITEYVSKTPGPASFRGLFAAKGIFSTSIGTTYSYITNSSFDAGSQWYAEYRAGREIGKGGNRTFILYGAGLEHKRLNTSEGNIVESANGLLNEEIDFGFDIYSIYVNPGIMYSINMGGINPGISAHFHFGYCINRGNAFHLLRDGVIETAPYDDVKSLFDTGFDLAAGVLLPLHGRSAISVGIDYRLEKLSFDLSHSRYTNHILALSAGIVFN